MASLTISDCDKSSATKSLTAPSTPQAESVNLLAEARFPNFSNTENVCIDSPSGPCHDGETPSNISLQETSQTSIKTIDHVDLLREQVKILSGEVALHSSILKRLSDEAAKSPNKEHIQLEIGKVKDEIKMKNLQIASLKKQMANSISVVQNGIDNLGITQSYDELLDQLNEKSFELEVKTADNRVLQDQLQQKKLECEKLHELVASLKQQLVTPLHMHLSRERSPSVDVSSELSQQAHMESEIEELKLKLTLLTESKTQLEIRNQKITEESAYAKGLASAAGVELRALSEEVTKLMKDKEKLVTELSTVRNNNSQRRPVSSGPRTNIRRESQIVTKKKERELLLENALKEKEQRECELLKKVEESEKKEAILENELSNMWQLVAKLKKAGEMEEHIDMKDDQL